jgi:hypothetical protein
LHLLGKLEEIARPLRKCFDLRHIDNSPKVKPLALRGKVVIEDPLARTFEIIILPGTEAPQKRRQRAGTHGQCDGNKEQETDHVAAICSRAVDRRPIRRVQRRRNPFATTINDELDMATAAISGVT